MVVRINDRGPFTGNRVIDLSQAAAQELGMQGLGIKPVELWLLEEGEGDCPRSLSVSAPFHSSLMKPAADKLRQRLAETSFAAPQIPVINNIDVAEQADPEKIRDALYRQAFGPVRWVECVQAIVARGVGAVVECGPGKALTGMNKRIDAGLQALSISDPQTLAATLATLQTT